jgi:hypothetical protein
MDANSLLIEFCGHTDESSVRQFYFLYRITLSNSHAGALTVHPLSHTVRPANNDSPSDCTP